MPTRRCTNRGTPSDGVAVFATRGFASQSRPPSPCVEWAILFCMDGADLSKTAKARHFVAFDITVATRRRNIYGRHFVCKKNPLGAGLQHELFAVKRYCRRAAECKSVSDVCRQKVLPRGEALRLANVRSPQSLRVSRLSVRPLNAWYKRYCLWGTPTFVGRLSRQRRHCRFVFPDALTRVVGRLACAALFSGKR